MASTVFAPNRYIPLIAGPFFRFWAVKNHVAISPHSQI